MDVKNSLDSKKVSTCKENHSCGFKSTLPNISVASIKICECNTKEDELNCKLKKCLNLKTPNNESKTKSHSKNNFSDLNVSENLEVIDNSKVERDCQSKRCKSLPLNNSNSNGRKSISKSKFMAHCGISFIPSPSKIISNPFKPIKNQKCSISDSLISGRKSTDLKTTPQLTNHTDISSPPYEESRKIVSALRKSINTMDLDPKIFPVQYHTGHTGLIFKRKQQKRNSINPFEQNMTT